MSVEIRRLSSADVDALMAAGHLFDASPRREWAVAFLAKPGHHLLLATAGGSAAGFVTGIENAHPDKGTEMLLYELGVDEAFRRRGIGRGLVNALADLAVELGCYGMWVPIEPDNDAAIATYRSAGSAAPAPAATMSWDFSSRR